jgi:hypothetical protein
VVDLYTPPYELNLHGGEDAEKEDSPPSLTTSTTIGDNKVRELMYMILKNAKVA